MSTAELTLYQLLCDVCHTAYYPMGRIYDLPELYAEAQDFGWWVANDGSAVCWWDDDAHSAAVYEMLCKVGVSGWL